MLLVEADRLGLLSLNVSKGCPAGLLCWGGGGISDGRATMGVCSA